MHNLEEHRVKFCDRILTASLKRYQEKCLLHQETERIRRDEVLAPRVIGGDETVVRSVGGRRPG